MESIKEKILEAYKDGKIINMKDLAKEYQDWLSKKPQKSGKIPVYKGCLNKQCFCTGACKEIVAWVDNPVDKPGLGGTTFTVKLYQRFTNNI